MIQEDVTAGMETWSEWDWRLEEGEWGGRLMAHNNKGWSIQGQSHEKAN